MSFFDYVLQFGNTGLSRHINVAEIRRDAFEVMINEEVMKFFAVDHDAVCVCVEGGVCSCL